uniref:Uncharacterized protein n=1 Tax=Anguilla anguilla TaxID=7936 RepID=A0A0E9QYE1_ANGAN
MLNYCFAVLHFGNNNNNKNSNTYGTITFQSGTKSISYLLRVELTLHILLCTVLSIKL